MNGWAMVFAAIVLFVAGSIVVNARLRRRHEAVAGSRPDWNDHDFVLAMNAEGIDRHVSERVLFEFRPFYLAGLSPHPDDDLDQLLRMDPDDLVEIVETIVTSLGQRLPEPGSFDQIPRLATVGDVARWIDQRSRR